MPAAFTQEILVSFTDNALTLVEEGLMPIVIPYHEHPQVFGHPRFLMADFDQGAALVRTALKQLKGSRFALIAPKIIVSIDRPVTGGITEMDKSILNQVFTEAGARKVEFKNT